MALEKKRPPLTPTEPALRKQRLHRRAGKVVGQHDALVDRDAMKVGGRARVPRRLSSATPALSSPSAPGSRSPRARTRASAVLDGKRADVERHAGDEIRRGGREELLSKRRRAKPCARRATKRRVLWRCCSERRPFRSM